MNHQSVQHSATTAEGKTSNLVIKAPQLGLVGQLSSTNHLVVRADKFSREGSHLPDKKKIRVNEILDLVYLS